MLTKIYEKLVEKSYIFFYIFWAIFQLGKGFGLTNSSIEFKYLILFAIPFFALRMLTVKWERKEIIVCSILLLIGGLVYLNSGSTTVLLAILCISSAKGISILNALKISLFIRGSLFLIRTSLAILNFIDPQLMFRDLHGVITGVRYGLGYGHPNSTQIELMFLILTTYLLYFKKMKWYHHVLILLYNCFIFSYTDSRTAFFLAFLFIIMSIVLSNIKYSIFSVIIEQLSKYGMLLLSILSIIGCVMYSHGIIVNNFGTFGARFQTAIMTFNDFPIRLFGNANVSTDLGYCYLLYRFGLCIFFLFYYAYYRLSKIAIENKIFILQLIIIFISGFTVLEHTAFSILSNNFILFLSWIIYPYVDKSVVKK